MSILSSWRGSVLSVPFLLAPLVLIGCSDGASDGPVDDGGVADAFSDGDILNADGGPAASDAASDGANPTTPEGGIASDPKATACGTSSCNTSTQQCCIAPQDGGVTSTCQTTGSACSGASFACDEAADCNTGEVCCAQLSLAGGKPTLKTTCEKKACDGLTKRQICRTTSECGSDTCIVSPCLGFAIETCGGLPEAVKPLCQ